MKTLITIAFMLLATLQSNGQKQTILYNQKGAKCVCGIFPINHLHQTLTQYREAKFDLKVSNEPVDLDAVLLQNNDTLYLRGNNPHIKFIKIGNRVYNIESPKIIEIIGLELPASVSYGAISVTGVSNHSNEVHARKGVSRI